MDDAAKLRFDTITNFSSLEELIGEGACEDLFFECKAPTQPKVNKDVKVKLAEAISGFSNTEGGILFYGIETSKLSHLQADVMIEIPRLGNIKNFTTHLVNNIPTLTMPAVTNFQTRIIKKSSKDSSGVLVLYIPKRDRPVQSLMDGKFHFRGGDQFIEAAYSVIERLFASNNSPDIVVKLDDYKYSSIGNGSHNLTMIIENQSLSVGKGVVIWMEVKDDNTLENFSAGSMTDASSSNKGKRVYTQKIEESVYNKLSLMGDTLSFEMKPRKRKVEVMISVYAENMLQKKYKILLQFNKSTLASMITHNESEKM